MSRTRFIMSCAFVTMLMIGAIASVRFFLHHPTLNGESLKLDGPKK